MADRFFYNWGISDWGFGRQTPLGGAVVVVVEDEELDVMLKLVLELVVVVEVVVVVALVEEILELLEGLRGT